MKLLIKQRVFSWTDTYDVYDENEMPKYFVKSDFFSIGHRIRVFDRNQCEVGMIQEKVISFLPKFEVYINGRMVGTIEKKFTLFNPQYRINYKGWSVQGNFTGWNYRVVDGFNQVISIYKEPFHWGDTYVLYFVNPADEIEGLLLTIAIDAANCSKNKQM